VGESVYKKYLDNKRTSRYTGHIGGIIHERT
jgi:hypothetical protein